MIYNNEAVSNNDESGMIGHPYLSSNPNMSYSAGSAVSSGSPSSSVPTAVGYQHYYGHSLTTSQPMFTVPQSTGFYPHGEINNSSPSVASSSSSIDSSRKTVHRKRNVVNNEKSTTKRKHKDDDELDDDDDDDDEENKCYLRSGSTSNAIGSTNHPHSTNNSIQPAEEDKEKQARENHCEIERRRRVKMATYFAELCDMVPSCANLARKPDKLTILRMAAQFMKTLRTNNNSTNLSSTQDLHKPSFLNDHELKYLMVESCDAFLFALNCDNLRIIYVSDAIQQILSYSCQDWYSRYFYDFIHPDDLEKVREQLNLQSSETSPNGVNGQARILDLKTGTVKKDGHTTGTRLVSSKRSFICRLRVGTTNSIESNPYLNPSVLRRRHRICLGPSVDGQIYEVVHISGYIRNLTNSHSDSINPHPISSNSNGQMAFIAIGRIQNSCSPNVNDLTNGCLSTVNSMNNEFTCRCHPETSEILFVDQRCSSMIGQQSQELLHKNLFEKIHPDDRLKFQEIFKRTVTQKNLSNNGSSNLPSLIVRFRTTSDNEFVSLKSSIYAFCNPCSDEIEFIIVTFLSMTNNKTSVIANSADFQRQNYENYQNYPNSEPTNYNGPSTTPWTSSNETSWPTTNNYADGQSIYSYHQ